MPRDPPPAHPPAAKAASGRSRWLAITPHRLDRRQAFAGTGKGKLSGCVGQEFRIPQPCRSVPGLAAFPSNRQWKAHLPRAIHSQGASVRAFAAGIAVERHGSGGQDQERAALLRVLPQCRGHVSLLMDSRRIHFAAIIEGQRELPGIEFFGADHLFPRQIDRGHSVKRQEKQGFGMVSPGKRAIGFASSRARKAARSFSPMAKAILLLSRGGRARNFAENSAVVFSSPPHQTPSWAP